MKVLLALTLMAGVASADPILSIDITTLPGEDYGIAIDLVRKAGATATSLSLMWDEAEKQPGVYEPEVDWPGIANAYYPSVDMAISLTLSLIDTVADRRPDDLKGRNWDDPDLLRRYAAYAETVLGAMPDADLTLISVGNEIDIFLQDQGSIAAYSRFLAKARDQIHQVRPAVPVGAKLTFDGFMSDPGRWQPLLDASDALMITYYPLTSDFALRPVADTGRDLAALAAAAPDMPIYLVEAGYPSDGCGAEPGGQEAFVATLLREAATIEQIRLISLTWLTDLPPEQVADYVRYYGVGGECFARYLGTLGLRDVSGLPKPALTALSRP